ncbi:Rv2175c family DNA-binding protein [Nakamurella endophytica]|uniref:Rv2175c family DNA-binding protein n=1 Tax=Nakamurella endophytica TaxID=1748367 RepID=UPI0035710DBE
MSDVNADTPGPDAGPPSYVPVPAIAAALHLVVTRVHQLLRDRQLVAVRRDGVQQIPLEFVDDTGVVKGLPGTITLLTDAGFSDQEIVDWLFEADDTLPGRPITALRENRGREVHRRAQVAGF